MANDFAVGVAQWNAEITLDAHLDERCVARKFLGNARRVVAKAASDYVFAGSAVEVVLDVGNDFAF